MRRKCIKLKSSADYGSPLDRFLCIDEANAEEILESIPNTKKFQAIVERILTLKNIYYDHYKREQINEKTRNISAIRFLGNSNIRIYCQEKTTKEGVLYIICAVSHNKKVQKNDKKIDTIINKIAEYEFEVHE